ncbi:MAG TPA: hypothetical protein VFF66_06550 [Brevundimonas sp.]|nr:hypothetical protein [Brevundimonas sp.]
MIRMRSALVIVVGAAASAACATALPPPPLAVLEYGRQDCALRPDLASAISLTPEKETNGHIVTTVIDAQTACLTTARGGVPYVIYALPEDLGDKMLSIGSVLEPYRILSPDVTVLDAQGEPTRTFAAEDYFYRGPVFSVQLRPREGEAFVMVAANPERIGQQYDSIAVGTQTTTVYTGYGAANWTTGHEASLSRTFSYEGVAHVTVYDTDTKEDE